jgi:PKD repeat protein
MRIFLLTIAVCALCVSCVEQPSACFTTDRQDEGDSVKVLTEIEFFSCSNDTETHHWDFGDSSSVNNAGTAIKHTYKKTGTYNVNLEVRNGTKTDATSHPVYVIP